MPWTVPADERAIRYLEGSLQSGRLAHAYLLSGPPGVGVMALARQLAQALLCEGPAPSKAEGLRADPIEGAERPCGACRPCRRVATGNHTDVYLVRPGAAGSILIEAVRELQGFASLHPFEAQGRVLIIEGAESMTREAANALLKLLEEPPPGVTLLLTTADEEAIPETVRSRCQPVRLRPLPFARVAEVLEAQGVAPGIAKRLARLTGGRLEAALALAQPEAQGLEDRREALGELLEIAGAGPAARLRRAGRMADAFFRDRAALYTRLDLWASLWRDALLLLTGASEGVADPEAAPELRRLASSGEDAAQALASILATADALRRNANPRLALEALLLNLPKGA